MRSLILVLVFATGAPAFATDNPNSISLELLGRGGLYSLNLDRMVTDAFALGIGFSTWSVSGAKAGENGSLKETLTVVPVYGNYYLMTGNNRIFGTMGIDVVSGSVSDAGLSVRGGSGAVFVGGVGYEYRGDNGLLIRVTPYVMVGNTTYGYFGVSGGYAF